MGLGVGTAYRLVRPGLGGVSNLRTVLVLGLAAIAGSDVPATALGVTDLRQWDLNSWVSDFVSHLAYGWATPVAYDAFAG